MTEKAILCIAKEALQNILDILEIEALGILKRVRGIKVVKKFLSLHKEVRLPKVSTIRFKEGAIPHTIPVYKRLPKGLKKATKKKLKQMEGMRV